jgi:diguanylate cyclase (GGDEF)-like protein
MSRTDQFRNDWLDHLLDGLLRASRPIRRWQAVALSLALLAGVATLDSLLGSRIQSDILYSFPVVIAAWSASRVDGVLMAVLASLLIAALDSPGSPAQSAIVSVVMFATRVSALSIIALTVSKLRAVTEEAERLADLDPLTGLLNRRSIEARLSLELARSTRQSSPLSVIYIDVDDFKSFNDRFGHGAGDEILRSVADCVTESLRNTDVVARLGGDEFVVVLPDTDSAGARRVGTELLEGLTQSASARGARVSAGAVTFNVPAASAESAIAQADNAMYAAKRRGKNCLVCESAPVLREATDEAD